MKSSTRPAKRRVRQARAPSISPPLTSATSPKKVICPYCEKPRHIAKVCYKLHVSLPAQAPHGTICSSCKHAAILFIEGRFSVRRNYELSPNDWVAISISVIFLFMLYDCIYADGKYVLRRMNEVIRKLSNNSISPLIFWRYFPV